MDLPIQCPLCGLRQYVNVDLSNLKGTSISGVVYCGDNDAGCNHTFAYRAKLKFDISIYNLKEIDERNSLTTVRSQDVIPIE